jgi:hypothetical protein
MSVYRFLVARFREPQDLRGTFAPFFRGGRLVRNMLCFQYLYEP